MKARGQVPHHARLLIVTEPFEAVFQKASGVRASSGTGNCRGSNSPIAQSCAVGSDRRPLVKWSGAFALYDRNLVQRPKCQQHSLDSTSDQLRRLSSNTQASPTRTYLLHRSILDVRLIKCGLPSWVLTPRQARCSRDIAVGLSKGKRGGTLTRSKSRVGVGSVFQHDCAIHRCNSCERLVCAIRLYLHRTRGQLVRVTQLLVCGCSLVRGVRRCRRSSRRGHRRTTRRSCQRDYEGCNTQQYGGRGQCDRRPCLRTSRLLNGKGWWCPLHRVLRWAGSRPISRSWRQITHHASSS